MIRFTNNGLSALARKVVRQCALTCFALLASAAMAQEKNAIEAIDAQQVGSNVVITVSLKNPPAQEPIAFAITNPARIAVDFASTTNATGASVKELGIGDLRSVNIVQADDRSRLVFNLKKPLNYVTEVRGKAVVMTIGGSQNEPVAVNSAAAPNAAGGAAGNQAMIRDIDFRRGNNGSGRVVVNLTGYQGGVNVRQQGKRVVVDFQRTEVPEVLRRRLDVSDFGTPVQMITTTVAGSNARMEIAAGGNWEHSAYQTDTQLVVEVKPVKAQEDAKRVRGPKSYRGERLSLNFQNVEIRAVLRVIADFTGLNIVTSDSVSGNLTLRLKDVPWDQALDIVLQAKGLAMRANGNVLWIAPKDEILTKEKLELEQQSQITELEPLITQSFRLNYHKAEAFRSMLQASKGEASLLSKRGSVVIDQRSNQLFITDTPSKLEEIEALIRKVDIPSRQVLIEARIVEADDKFSRNLGSKLAFGATQGRYSPNAAVGGQLGNPLPFGSSTDAMNNNVNLGNNVTLPAAGLNGYPPGAVALTLFNSAASRFLNLELTALEADGKGKILSSPRVITGDQMKALIEQGTELPYQQIGQGGQPSVSFRKANLKLEVTPQITPDNNVILDVDINKDSVGQATAAGFAIDTKHVKTQVLVENGGTVAIGGIYIQQDREAVTKIPLLGDIPLLGWLFKTKARTNDKTELIIFLTPKILDDKVQVR